MTGSLLLSDLHSNAVTSNAANNRVDETHTTSGHVDITRKDGSQKTQEGTLSVTAVARKSSRRVHWKTPPPSRQHPRSLLASHGDGNGAVLGLGALETSAEGSGLSSEEVEGLIDSLEKTTPSLSPVLNSLPSLHSSTPTLDMLLHRKVRRKGWRSRLTCSQTLPEAPLKDGEEHLSILLNRNGLQASNSCSGRVPAIKDGMCAGDCGDGVSTEEHGDRNHVSAKEQEGDDVSLGEQGQRGNLAAVLPSHGTVHSKLPGSNCRWEDVIRPSGRLRDKGEGSDEVECISGSLAATGVAQNTSSKRKFRPAGKQLESVPTHTDSHHCMADGGHSSTRTRKRQRELPPVSARVTRRMAALQRALLEEAGATLERDLPACKRSRTPSEVIASLEHGETVTLPGTCSELGTSVVKHTEAPTANSSVHTPKQAHDMPPPSSVAERKESSDPPKTPQLLTKVLLRSLVKMFVYQGGSYNAL